MTANICNLYKWFWFHVTKAFYSQVSLYRSTWNKEWSTIKSSCYAQKSSLDAPHHVDHLTMLYWIKPVFGSTKGGLGLGSTEGGLGLGSTEGGLGLGSVEGGLGIGSTEGGLGLGSTEGGLGLGSTEGGLGLVIGTLQYHELSIKGWMWKSSICFFNQLQIEQFRCQS